MSQAGLVPVDGQPSADGAEETRTHQDFRSRAGQIQQEQI